MPIAQIVAVLSIIVMVVVTAAPASAFSCLVGGWGPGRSDVLKFLPPTTIDSPDRYSFRQYDPPYDTIRAFRRSDTPNSREQCEAWFGRFMVLQGDDGARKRDAQLTMDGGQRGLYYAAIPRNNAAATHQVVVQFMFLKPSHETSLSDKDLMKLVDRLPQIHGADTFEALKIEMGRWHFRQITFVSSDQRTGPLFLAVACWERRCQDHEVGLGIAAAKEMTGASTQSASLAKVSPVLNRLPPVHDHATTVAVTPSALAPKYTPVPSRAEPLSPPIVPGKRVALVIGNSAYKHTPVLDNPRNDATDIALALGAVGFDVISGFDLDKAQFDRKVRDFANALSGADVGLFFYAGHGLQVGGQNFLQPIDAELTSASALDFDMVQLELVQRAMEREAKTNLIFLDACRNNPLTRNLARTMGTRSVAIGRGLAAVESGVGTLISFSTQPGAYADDGVGQRNSPYASALLKHLNQSSEDLSGMLIGVRREVRQATANKQVPWEHSSLLDRFWFKVAKP